MLSGMGWCGGEGRPERELLLSRFRCKNIERLYYAKNGSERLLTLDGVTIGFYYIRAQFETLVRNIIHRCSPWFYEYLVLPETLTIQNVSELSLGFRETHTTKRLKHPPPHTHTLHERSISRLVLRAFRFV